MNEEIRLEIEELATKAMAPMVMKGSLEIKAATKPKLNTHATRPTLALALFLAIPLRPPRQ